jgi:biopolymer transport protein ExbB
LRKAGGSRPVQLFFHDLRYLLASGSIDTAIRECDVQKGSIGRVLKAGLLKYKHVIQTDLERDQKVMAIQKEMDEVSSLELHSMEKNLVFLSTIASIATLMGLLGTVIGMITSFAALGDSGGGEAAQRLSQGISEALYNTAFGIGTSAVSIIMYNVFTTRIDGITYGIDEGAYLLTQSFKSTYKVQGA